MSGMAIGICLALALGIAALYLRGQRAAASPPAASPSKPATPAEAGPKKNWLVGEGGALDGKAFHVAMRIVTIGRATTNFIQVDDPAVSRQQCQLKPHANGLEVVDMTSANSMFVNGKGVNLAVLRDGDMLQLGTTSFIYWAEGDFGDNAAFAPKSAGKSVRTATEAMTADQARQLAEAWGMYEKHGKNSAAAAAAMGMDPAEFQALIDG